MCLARPFLLAAVGFSLAVFVGCGGKSDKEGPAKIQRAALDYVFPVKAGKYVVLDILTDNKDESRARGNAEDTLANHTDIKCMVGLWAYNPPQILLAVKGADKLGQVKIVGFDEHDATLQAIQEGHIEGTIVQQPFMFGYKSTEYLAAMARGQQVKIPENKMMYVDHTVISPENVTDFRETTNKIKAGQGEPPPADRDDYDTSRKVRVGFLTNSVDDFWVLAQRGCELAAKQFNVDSVVYHPPNGTVEEQKKFIEDFISTKGEGLAISPIDPANQGQIIDQACESMPVICQDSDAPKTNRRFYLGTSNYLAGRAAGELVKKAIPDGGKVMIFVGKLEVLNAQERSKGVIDELMDAPIPAEYQDQVK